MNCPSCNTPNRDDAKFCKSCGRPLSPAGTSSASIPSSPEDAQSSSAVGTLTDQTSTTSASPQGDTKPILVQENTSDVEDIATEPTLVLSPDQMESYRRRWQPGEEQDNQGTLSADLPSPNASATSTVTREQQSTDIAEMPTLVTTPTDNNVGTLSGDEVAAHFNTLGPQNNASLNETPLPQPSVPANNGTAAPSANEELLPPPPETENPSTPTGTSQTGEPETATNAAYSDVSNTAPTGTSASASGDTSTNATTNAPVNADQAPPTTDFPVLPVGTMLAARYEITQILEETPQEHTYLVTDHQGYQHCWNCDSEDNAAGDEFCSNCGAELLGQSYIMHEYPATATSQEEDAPVLQGNIVNTFIERGQTYMIEQPHTAQNAFPNGVQLLAACSSDAGNVRRSEPNEDCTLVLLLQRVYESIATPAGVFIVADGMGGHAAGEVASEIAVDTVSYAYYQEDGDDIAASLVHAIKRANTLIHQRAAENMLRSGMGTTCVAGVLRGGVAYIANVGDSRTYLVRHGQVRQVSQDHSWVAEQVRAGLLSEEQARSHAQRNVITRCLGTQADVEVDIFAEPLEEGDSFVLCSDGLSGFVSDDDLRAIVNQYVPQESVYHLVERANENGGPDNITAIVVRVQEVGWEPAPAHLAPPR